MQNKSFASSELGGDEDHFGDPEFSKDFSSAYQKVEDFLGHPFYFSWLKRYIRNKETQFLFHKMKSIDLNIWYNNKLISLIEITE